MLREGVVIIKNIKIKLFLIGLVLFVIMSISGIYALNSQKTDGDFNTKIVDIQLQTYGVDDENNEIEYDDSKNVMPGEVITFMPKVSNVGEPCYIRLKINYVDENTDFMDYVTGFSSSLAKHGDYYYYEKIFDKNEVLKVFDSIQIPSSISSDEDSVKIVITAQAIQTRNFEPDYSLEDPWKSIDVQETVNSSYEIGAGFNIRFEDNTDGEVKVPNDYMSRFYNMMPGDEFSDNIEIKNNRKNKVRYYLRLETNEKNADKLKLLSQIKFIITNDDGKTIYDGTLQQFDKILLSELNANEYEKLVFKVMVPIDINNKFENLDPDLTFVFLSEEESSIINPKTGDLIDVSMIIFLLSAMGLIIVIIIGYINNKKEYDSQE